MASIGRRRLLHGAAAATAALALRAPVFAQVADAARTAMTGTATAFLAALPADGRRRAVFAFDDRERLNWGTSRDAARASPSRRSAAA